MKNFVLFKYPVTNGLFWGLITGLLYAFMHSFDPNISLVTKQLIDLGFYLTFVIASALTLNLVDSQNKFLKIFLTTSLTFMLIFAANPIRLWFTDSFFRYNFSILTFFELSLIGLGLCAVLSFLVTRRL